MTQQTVIGIVGHKRSGKDTAYKIIKQLLSKKNVVRLAFADELKLEIASVLTCNLDLKEVMSNEQMIQYIDYLKETLPEFRKVLQDYGTRRKEEEGFDYWIRKFKAKFDSLPPNSVVCITDVRYQEEANYVSRILGGKLLRVRRGLVDNEQTDTHSSETNVSKIVADYYVYNDNTVQLYAFELWNILMANYKLEELNGKIMKHTQINYDLITK